MPLIQLPASFDDLDFLFEVKFDGFRAMAYVEDGTCELVSRKRLPEVRRPSHRASASVAAPQTDKATPVAAPSQWPAGTIFSNSTNRARPTIQ